MDGGPEEKSDYFNVLEHLFGTSSERSTKEKVGIEGGMNG